MFKSIIIILVIKMRKEKCFEVFFTSDFVTEEKWLQFLLYISKLNGLFRVWKIFIKFEKIL